MQWESSKIPNHACVNLRIGENHASRHIYFFIKALSTSTQQVFVYSDISFIRRLLKDHYASFILNESLVKFRIKPSATCKTFSILPGSDVKISYDYFSLLLSELPIHPNHYHVPIGMHPLQYHLKLDKIEYALPRKRTLFFSGNLKPKGYANFDERHLFNMPGRLEMFEAMKDSSIPLATNVEAQELCSENWEGKAVICDSNCCNVPNKEWRKILAGMHFFLCFPGQVMPFCHNIYEVMSVGTIPVLHKNYAILFNPPLENKINCLTFSNIENFIDVCDEALKSSDGERAQMHHAVTDYYNSHLTPEAVGKKITDPATHTVYLQAEQYSVALFNLTDPT